MDVNIGFWANRLLVFENRF